MPDPAKPPKDSEYLSTLERGLRVLRASHEPFKPDLSPASRALIKGLFVLDPERRLTAELAGKHSWIAAGAAAVAASRRGHAPRASPSSTLHRPCWPGRVFRSRRTWRVK